MELDKLCRVCGTPYALENHHVIYRSQVKSLEHCPANQIWLCNIHHRDHRNGVHHNTELDNKFKLEFQNWLEMSFLKDSYSQDEIKAILQIGTNATRSLCKLMVQRNGVYSREEIILKCMGGALCTEESA